jgi:hypothetical protein
VSSQVWEYKGQWCIEGYDDLRFSSKEGAEQYYATHLIEENLHKRMWRWSNR